ncbi:MAG: hypothetical protein IJB16_07655 [Clostridia bacterium]|nr:hypothetical protein [Clostridia bacterium]
MYRAEKEQAEFEDCIKTVCGIADENGMIITFTSDFETAEEFARLLNKLSVEICHVTEIAEDMFYS